MDQETAKRYQALRLEPMGFDEPTDRSRWLTPGQRLIRMCRLNPKRRKVVDLTGELTSEQLLMRVLIFRRLLRREVLASDEMNVGVLIPPSLGSVLATYALTLDRRVPIHLNYTLRSSIINHCIHAAGVRHVLTSRKVLEKFPDLKIDAELILLEDYLPKVKLWDKLACFLGAKFATIRWLEKRLKLDTVKPDDLNTIIFTSGSTGTPKGVMLSHWNVLRNVESLTLGAKVNRDDVFVGVLPFFHAFGYTVPLWVPFVRDVMVVFHSNPLDVQTVGRLCRKYGATYFLATPTFARTFVKRCPREDLATTDMMILGAEKMPKTLADEYEAKFGIRPVEGYGATELSPVVAVNFPPHRSRRPGDYLREGTIGRPFPGVRGKIVDPETFIELGPDREGMLLVSGDIVMKGYLDMPEQTAAVMRDGWYVTGDMAVIDEDGFIRITGRLTRFSKLGGEMVPHLRLEEVLFGLLGLGDDGGEGTDGMAAGVPLAVTAVPDAKKGERIIVLHTMPLDDLGAICQAMHDAGLPNLWIPSANSFYRVDSIPVLGTGKLDLRAVKQMAIDLTAGQG